MKKLTKKELKSYNKASEILSFLSDQSCGCMWYSKDNSLSDEEINELKRLTIAELLELIRVKNSRKHSFKQYLINYILKLQEK